MSESIYLDHNATTPLDERVFRAMRPFFLEEYGNAASSQHAFGRRAFDAVGKAREQIVHLIGADPREIVWTSGATESNNLALKGLAAAPAYRKKRHLVTVATEHKAVLDPCATLEEDGYDVTYLGVDRSGLIDLDELVASLRSDTLVVSIMAANNETGVLQDLARIGSLCKENGVLFHTDATQAFGKEPLDVQRMGIDLLSCSAHKVYGPKGVGALFLRRKGPRVRCRALIDGGGHERGVRSGTLNVPGIVGFGAAAELAATVGPEERERLGSLRDRFEAEVMGRIPDVVRNGHADRRLANTANLRFLGVDAESLMRRLPNLAVSASAACTSSDRQPSYVLSALGLSLDEVRSSLRISLGRFTAPEELNRAAEWLDEAVRRERSEGPLAACSGI